MFFSRLMKAETMQKQNIHIALFPDSAVDKVCCSHKHISIKNNNNNILIEFKHI